jgi:hypothetical protein
MIIPDYEIDFGIICSFDPESIAYNRQIFQNITELVSMKL